MAGEELNLDDPVASFTSVWKAILSDPRAFFAALPTAGGLQAPLAFAAISLFLGGVGVLVFGGGIKGLLALVVFGVIRLFVGAAIIGLIAQNLFHGKGDFEATFRVLAYSSAAAVFVGLPVIKYFAALYATFLLMVGIERAHSLEAVPAFLTLLASAIAGFVALYALGLWPVLAPLNPLLR